MLSTTTFILYIAAALALGAVVAASYGFKSDATRSFLATLFLFPALVAVVIMMVNGSIGTGVAVAGTFGLVRFRSAPGNAKQIAAVFLSMATGIICGMGYLTYAAIFTGIICAVLILLKVTGFDSAKTFKELHITIPEDLDYEGVFDEIFDKYTDSKKLMSVKTSDMGSLFRLKYSFSLKPHASEKDFIDKLRVKNGNLPISVCEASTENAEDRL